MNRAIAYYLFISVACYAVVAASPCAAADLIINADTVVDAQNQLDNRPFSVEVVRGPAGPTKLRIVDGGLVANDLRLFDDSMLEMSDGEILKELQLSDTSQATVRGGVVGDNITVGDSSRLSILRDAVLRDTVSVSRRGAQFFMGGGVIQGKGNREPFDSTLTVGGTAEISGGSILAPIGFQLGIAPSGVVTVVGRDLVRQPMVNPPFAEGEQFYTIQGALADGTQINWNVALTDGGQLLLVPEALPSPGWWASLCITLVAQRPRRFVRKTGMRR